MNKEEFAKVYRHSLAEKIGYVRSSPRAKLWMYSRIRDSSLN